MCAEPGANEATQVVELTPPGRAAVAVLLVSGPDALHAVEACFAPAGSRSLAGAPPGRIVLGRWGGPDGEELVVCRRSDTQIEVHSHGGRAAVRAVVDALADRGCRPARWQDWLQAGAADPIRTAAQIALADAPTARTAAVLVDQYHGALAAAIRTARNAVLAGRWPAAAGAIDAVLPFRNMGQHLTSPWRVVLAGRTNVGKSSLINALAGYQRAIVCELPGTTRDVLTTTTAIDGWPVQLADTAGLRPAGDELEAAGVARAAVALADADLVVIVRDATDPNGQAAGDVSIGAQLPATARVLHVLNKIDLVASRDRLASPPDADPVDVHFTSALTGEGIPALVAAIGRALVPVAPATGAAVPFRADQVASLEAARDAIEQHDRATVLGALEEWLAE